MQNPKPINLQTSEEVRKAGWGAESRDSDGHLISCYAPIDDMRDMDGVIEWIRECIDSKETVTIWPSNG